MDDARAIMDVSRSYVGLANSFHDSAIAIVDDRGEVVFAEATERYIQNKRSMNIAADVFQRTSELIREYCKPSTEIVTAYTWREAADWYERWYARGAPPKAADATGALPFMQAATFARRFSFRSLAKSRIDLGATFEYELSRTPGWESASIIRRSYEHHLTHAATACFASPFDEAVCAIIDGYGERRSTAYFAYRDGKLEDLGLTEEGDGSLGVFFQEVCDACGFGFLTGEEWKVMGLAAYGEHDERLYGIFRDMVRANGVRIQRCDSLTLMRRKRELHALRRKPGEPAIAAANIAHAGQKVFTEVLLECLNNLYKLGHSRNLVFGGGCALNSSANGRVLEQTPFENLYVFSAPADDGNAIGAALLAYQEDHPEYRPRRGFQTPYLGSSMSDETVANVRRFSRIDKIRDCRGSAPRRAAELLAAGKIVGWIQGRAEFGPRALGNRSILADPRSHTIKDTINSRVKFREEFRPFAPAILHEHGPEYFFGYQESPYMERTLRFRPEAAERVPGAVHQDGTGRLQTVKREWNPAFYDLIEHFYRLTGVPLVINTSFNVMGKPIAHSVEDVLAVFYSTGLDAVFVDDLVIEK